MENTLENYKDKIDLSRRRFFSKAAKTSAAVAATVAGVSATIPKNRDDLKAQVEALEKKYDELSIQNRIILRVLLASLGLDIIF